MILPRKDRIEVAGIVFVPEQFWDRFRKSSGCWEWTGGKNENGYGQVNARINGHKTTIGAHRLAYVIEHGPIPEGKEIDHTCHNTSCVNPSHFRLANRKQNAENRSGLIASNTSGYTGVSWNKASGRWMARVTHHRRQIFVGQYSTAEEAGAAAAAKRLELFTHNDLDRQVAA